MKIDCHKARKALKNNFLKHIILRVDFGGLADSEVGDCFEQIKKILLDNGYDNFLQADATQMMFKVFDPEEVVQDFLHVDNVEKHKVYVFSNQERDRIFQISNTVAVMTISPTHYVPFVKYAEPFIQIMNILKDKAGKLFFLKRFGVRKLNICILLNELTVIKKYFEPDMFSPLNLNKSPDTIKSYQCVDCLREECCEINLVRQIREGQVKGKRAYQIVLDTDAYLVNRENINCFLNDSLSFLKNMNDLLLKKYLQAISDGFYKELCEKSFKETDIRGVVNNG